MAGGDAPEQTPGVPRRLAASPTVTVRLARPADLPALARMGAKLARAHHAWDPERFFAPEEPLEDGYAWWLGKELENPRAVVLAAVAGRGRVVGYAYGRIEPRDWNSLRDRCGVGVDLWVEPEARRAGVGRRLVESLVAALGERGAPRVIIGVAERNRDAQRAFARLGFRRTMVELTRELAPPTASAPRTRSDPILRPIPRSRRPRAGSGPASTRSRR
jgi:ribosomal protein S18 acetylase RimI-like enzyme